MYFFFYLHMLATQKIQCATAKACLFYIYFMIYLSITEKWMTALRNNFPSFK